MAVLHLYGKLGSNIFGGETAGESISIDYLSDTIKAALATSSYSPNVDTHEFFSDITNELPTALGYTAGGVTLGSKTNTYNSSGNKTILDAADPSWTASGGSLVFQYVILYKSTGTAATSPLIGYLDVGTQTITDGNTVTFSVDASSGVLNVVAS